MTLADLPGAVVWLDRAASVQFIARPPVRFRVSKVLPWQAPWGWVWLAGYQLNGAGSAVAQREVMVRRDGLRLAEAPAARVPAQRRSPTSLQGVRR